MKLAKMHSTTLDGTLVRCMPLQFCGSDTTFFLNNGCTHNNCYWPGHRLSFQIRSAIKAMGNANSTLQCFNTRLGMPSKQVEEASSDCDRMRCATDKWYCFQFCMWRINLKILMAGKQLTICAKRFREQVCFILGANNCDISVLQWCNC